MVYGAKVLGPISKQGAYSLIKHPPQKMVLDTKF